MKITVEVTQEDIDLGHTRDTHTCAVQRALHRRVSVPIWAGPYYIGSGRDAIVPTPDEARNWILTFDRDKSLGKPFCFELELPDEIVLLEAAP